MRTAVVLGGKHRLSNIFRSISSNQIKGGFYMHEIDLKLSKFERGYLYPFLLFEVMEIDKPIFVFNVDTVNKSVENVQSM